MKDKHKLPNGKFWYRRCVDGTWNHKMEFDHNDGWSGCSRCCLNIETIMTPTGGFIIG